MNDTTWTILPRVGCGPFHFGMSQASFHEIAGSFATPATNQDGKVSGWFDGQPLLSAEFFQDSLVRIDLNPLKFPSLTFDGVDILTLPTLEVVKLLAAANAGISQAQGGSLYFDTLGLAILQFETSAMRNLMLWSPAYDPNEPLADVSFEAVTKYYDEQRAEIWPSTDLFGEDQAPITDD